jgi:tetratricopeptide (TPR) repeat protein
MRNKLLTSLTQTFALVLFVSSCASGSKFNKVIQKDQNDLLTEESFMRYNSNRLSTMDTPKRDFISRALIACHQEKITKGLEILEDKMQQSKSNSYYWNAIGTCHSLNKDFSKAIFFYDLGLEASRSKSKDLTDQEKKIAEAVVNNNLGLIHLAFKRYDEAYDAFNRSHELAPNYLTPEFNMAQLYVEFNDNSKALDILKRLEAKNSEDIDLLYSLSLVYFKMNDSEKSYQYITRIQKDYLNRADIVGLYAYNLMKKNRLEEAKQVLEKRLYSSEYNTRNELILDEVNLKIKDKPKP